MARGNSTPQDEISKKIFSNNLNNLLSANNTTQAELHRFTQIPKSTLTGYVKGTSLPNAGNVQKIADFFGILKSELDPRFSSSNRRNVPIDIINIYSRLEEKRQQKVYTYAEQQLEEQKQSTVVDLEEYKDIKIQSTLSAGSGIIDLDPEHTEDYRFKGEVPEHDMAFKVSGDSMEPLFEDGEIIFVKRIDEPRSGQVVAITINDEAFIKKLYIEENCFRLVSLNKAYDDIKTDKNDDVKIVGKVIL